MSVEIVNPKACAGCGACAAACPIHCISMDRNDKGFQVPRIDSSTCIQCDKCEKVCQILHPISNACIETDEEAAAYACRNIEERARLNSSSGGVFPLLAELTIEKGGVVFGAAFDEAFNVRHIAVEDKEGLGLLYGSKYVQSNLGNTYKAAEEYLKSGVQVLFSGTPCQIEGLYCFLGKDYENLITVGVSCHGAPSPAVWEKYTAEKKQDYKGKITAIRFRDKKTGWKNYSLTLAFENGEEYSTPFGSDLYMLCFLINYSLRDACYICPHKGAHRNSDITLADFWGIEKELPEMDDDTGTSLVLLQTPKGEKLFHEIRNGLECKDVDTELAVGLNAGLSKQPHFPEKREQFFRNLYSMKLETAYKNAETQPVFNRIKRRIMRKLRR